MTLTDGTEEEGDLLIGADGLHSATRALLFGPEEDFLLDLEHKVAVYMLDKRPASIATGATGTLSSGGRIAAVISIPDSRIVAFFGYRADHARPGEDVTTELRPELPGWASAPMPWPACSWCRGLRQEECCGIAAVLLAGAAMPSQPQRRLTSDALADAIRLAATHTRMAAAADGPRAGSAARGLPEDILSLAGESRSR
ncbi:MULTISPECIES: hypothetical protein [Nonomuraea]|uniref:FAD binding domain-containing protein n=2 Tax=Nonomuraea TaxID=83681 RepID=A0ABT4SZS3_9ACTN|nr:hypothetical protein [Nonomuraea ferruginea]MDA0642529.1 hypothetical protein [Nonomuraea ferruginea]